MLGTPCIANPLLWRFLFPQLLEGVSGVDYISRFDASDFPTKFAAQIKDFDVGDLVDKKNARRYDDCLSYTMVASKKVRWRAAVCLPGALGLLRYIKLWGSRLAVACLQICGHPPGLQQQLLCSRKFTKGGCCCRSGWAASSIMKRC